VCEGRKTTYLPSEQLDYVKLMALAREGPEDESSCARVAVLGFCTTHYYTQVLEGLGRSVGFPLATYESDYNAVEQAVLDQKSDLYTFNPDFVVFATAVQALRPHLLNVPPSQRLERATQEAERVCALARRAAKLPGVNVVVHKFVVPYERPWGNLTGRIEGSLSSAVRRMNEILDHLAAETANIHLVDCDHIASVLGKRAWFDERLWFHSKSFCHPDALPHVASQALDLFRAVKGRLVKCLLLDLDNTLWGGILGDEGLQGIRLGALGDGQAYVAFQAYLQELRRRGILLAVCSKNDEEAARQPFREHPDMVLREEDIACFVANWDDKVHNVRRIAERLNIGLDSMVFIDDSPFERNLVRDLVPEVIVPEMPEDPAEYVPYLDSLNLFETVQVSVEDEKRTEMIRADVQRRGEATKFGDLNQYLASLGMSAAFEPVDEYHLPRAAQLVQRTNQFNLTTIRHTAAELQQMAQDPDCRVLYATLEDRFGDSGLVSVVVGRRVGEDMEIVTWVMSCRVVSRRLEEFVLDRLVEAAREVGCRRLRGRYVPTRKNALVAGHYERLGFRRAESSPDGCTTWELDVSDYEPFDPPIRRKI